MTGFLALLVVLAGLALAIALGSRLLVLLFPARREQQARFRAIAEALGGRFRTSPFVADPELRLWLHGQPVFVTSTFAKHGYEHTRVRIDALQGTAWSGLYLDLEPGAVVEEPRLGHDGRAAAAELAELVGHACKLEIRQKPWGDLGFAELLCGGFLTDREEGGRSLARAILLMQRIALDPAPVADGRGFASMRSDAAPRPRHGGDSSCPTTARRTGPRGFDGVAVSSAPPRGPYQPSTEKR